MDNNFLKVIKVLRDKKISEDKINEFINKLKEGAGIELYNQMLTHLTDTDIQEIEKTTDDKKAFELIKSLFEKRTGKNAEEFAQEFYNNFADGFLESYNKQQSN